MCAPVPTWAGPSPGIAASTAWVHFLSFPSSALKCRLDVTTILLGARLQNNLIGKWYFWRNFKAISSKLSLFNYFLILSRQIHLLTYGMASIIYHFKSIIWFGLDRQSPKNQDWKFGFFKNENKLPSFFKSQYMHIISNLSDMKVAKIKFSVNQSIQNQIWVT